MAEILGRTYNSVGQACKRLGISVIDPSLWTSQEIEILKDWVANNSTWKGIPIDRSKNAITVKAHQMGLYIRGKQQKRIKKDKEIYFIKPGLEGLIFDMPKAFDSSGYNCHGQAEHSMYGHVIYEA